MQTYSQGPLRQFEAGPLTEQQQKEVTEELQQLIKETGFRLPVRSFIYDQTYEWRFGGPPNYDLVNLLYMQGKSMNHVEGSVEQLVEDLVKTWEMERSHKVNVLEHKTCDHDKFLISHDGKRKFKSAEAHEIGNYNVLLEGTNPELWKPGQSWHDSHQHFKDAFAAFPWELLAVFSGPPRVAFAWRHWAHFTGTYKGNKGKGQLLNLIGFGVGTVNHKLEFLEIEIYGKPEEFLEALEGKRSAESLNESATGPLKPYIEKFCPVTGLSGSCQA